MLEVNLNAEILTCMSFVVAAATAMDAFHVSGGQRDFVFSLPHDLAVRLLRSWLTLPDIAHLDSAICNHKKRGSFLSLLSSRERILDGIH